MWADTIRRSHRIVAGGGSSVDKTHGLFTTSFLSSAYDTAYPASGAAGIVCPVTDASFKLPTLTAEIWYQFGTVQNFFWPLELYPRGDGYNSFQIQIAENLSTNQGRIMFYYAIAGAQHNMSNTFTLAPGQWLHAVVTQNTNGHQNIYANGVNIASDNRYTGTPYYGTDVGVYLNRDYANNVGSSTYSGTMRRVKVYNTELTSAQVSTAYSAGPPTI